MRLISRDCCPYLDDFEPDYLPAVAAIALDDVQTISWDPGGPTFVEPPPAYIHEKLPDGECATAEAGRFAQSWSDSDDEPPSLTESSCDSDSGEDSSDYDGTVHQAVPGISSTTNGSRLRDDDTEPGWTVVGKINPQPIKLSPKGLKDILYHLSRVEMVPSARKAVAGDGICIGLTFKTSSFIHPKTDRNRDLIEAIVAEVRSHDELKNIAFTSIQLNHNTISAPTPTTI